MPEHLRRHPGGDRRQRSTGRRGINRDATSRSSRSASIRAKDPRRRATIFERLAEQRPTALAAGRAHGHAKRAIHAVTDALGYRYAWSDQLRQYAHLRGTAVLTPDGKLSSWLYGLSPTPAQLDAALAQATAGRSGGVMQQILLLCFHYDPQTGRYSLAITKALRLAGIATVLLSRSRSAAFAAAEAAA